MFIVVFTSSPFRISQCSPDLEELIGFSANEIEGRTIKVLTGPETNFAPIQAAIKATAFQETTTLSTSIYHKAAHTIKISLICTPELGLNGCRLTFIRDGENIAKQETKHDDVSFARRPAALPQKAFAHDVFDRVCIAQHFPEFSTSKKFRCFKIQKRIQYFPYCDDFGPLSIDSIATFVELLDQELGTFPDHKIVFCAEDGPRALTNAVMLLGSYMVLRLNMSAAEVCQRFRWLDAGLVEGYRDASFANPDFELSLGDCWGGLERGRRLGWVGLPAALGAAWGQVDIAEYRQLDDPLNGSVNQVVPGKFVALPTPVDLGTRAHRDHGGERRFSPAFYGPLLQELGVTDVVRLNEAEYDAADLTREGLRHHDLIFEDCAAPPPAVVEAFLTLVDAAEGAVAVHCKAGLGRTGTLIALWLMRSRGFSAREAIGWLRIMRPGSVIGEQQHYLCAVERATARSEAARAPLVAASGTRTKEERAAVAEQVAAAAAARRRLACGDMCGPINHGCLAPVCLI